MKIKYITNARIPTEKAHGYQIVKMCSEYSKLGYDVELILPARNNYIKNNLFEYYGIENNFKVRYLAAIDFIALDKILGALAFYLQSLTYILRLLFEKIYPSTIVYTRSAEICWLFGLKGEQVIYEAHNWPMSKTGFYKKLLKKAKLIVCNSQGTRDKFFSEGFSNAVVATNGVDLKDFNVKKSKSELRRELSLDNSKFIVSYVGHLYEWKGVNTIVRAAMECSNKNIQFLIVGGVDKDLESFRKKYEGKLSNIVLAGRKNRKKIPLYLKASDVLLLPNIPSNEESINYTSPIKMFEYMASKIPIVASNLPSIKSVLNPGNSYLIEPSKVSELLIIIEDIVNDYANAQKKAKQAYEDVAEYTWGKRAKKILYYFNNVKI